MSIPTFLDTDPETFDTHDLLVLFMFTSVTIILSIIFDYKTNFLLPKIHLLILKN